MFIILLKHFYNTHTQKYNINNNKNNIENYINNKKIIKIIIIINLKP